MVVKIMTAERGDAAANARAYRDKHRLTYPVLVDANQSAARAYEVRAFPTNLVIDKEGVVRYRGEGFDGAALDAAVRQWNK